MARDRRETLTELCAAVWEVAVRTAERERGREPGLAPVTQCPPASPVSSPSSHQPQPDPGQPAMTTSVTVSLQARATLLALLVVALALSTSGEYLSIDPRQPSISLPHTTHDTQVQTVCCMRRRTEKLNGPFNINFDMKCPIPSY